MLTHVRTHWSLVSSCLYPKIRVSYQGYVFSHKDKTCRGISSSMDVCAGDSTMCSDRVGRAVVIFDVFQSSVSDVTSPISVMAFHTGKLAIFKSTKYGKCAICVPSLMSTTANSQTINSNSSPDQMKTSLSFPSFSPPLSPSLSPPPLRAGNWYVPERMLMIQCWTYWLLRHVGQRVLHCSHTHTYRYKTIIIHHHALVLSQNTQHKSWRLNFIALQLEE